MSEACVPEPPSRWLHGRAEMPVLQVGSIFGKRVIPRRLVLSKYGWLLLLIQLESVPGIAKLREYRADGSLSPNCLT